MHQKCLGKNEHTYLHQTTHVFISRKTDPNTHWEWGFFPLFTEKYGSFAVITALLVRPYPPQVQQLSGWQGKTCHLNTYQVKTVSSLCSVPIVNSLLFYTIDLLPPSPRIAVFVELLSCPATRLSALLLKTKKSIVASHGLPTGWKDIHLLKGPKVKYLVQ